MKRHLSIGMRHWPLPEDVDWCSVDVLLRLVNPLAVPPWEGVECVIEPAEVLQAVRMDCLRPWDAELLTREHHIERIAWFVVNGWTDTIELDIGAPDLGWTAGWPIQDGNHRFAAAIVRGDSLVATGFSGSLDYGEEIGLLVSSKTNVLHITPGEWREPHAA